MHPSESKRHLSMFFSDAKMIQLSFFILSMIPIIVGIVLFIVFHGRTFVLNGQTNGVPTVNVVTILPFTLALCGFGLIFLIVTFCIGKVAKYVVTIPPYPVKIENRIRKQELLARAQYEISQLNPLWEVKVNGNWIDVTWNWKNVLALYPLDNIQLNKEISTYSKFIEVGDDYTYKELDMKQSGSFGVDRTGIHLHKGVFIGHLKDYSIQLVPGMDLNNGEVDFQKYELNTSDISNAVHEWLAEYGYAYRASMLDK